MVIQKQLGELLVEAGIISARTLERALERQKLGGRRLGTVLEEMGVLTADELVEALARQLSLRSVKEICGYTFPPELLALVPVDLAVSKSVFPLKEKDGVLALAVTDPFDGDTLDYLGKKTRLRIVPVLATQRDIAAAIRQFYLHGKEETSGVRKILVIEDSGPVANIIQAALEKEGYAVAVGSDGVEGLKLALAERPELIICDSVMPRMDGFGLLRALRGTPQTAAIPVILLTSKASAEEEQKALQAGFFDFIAKPVLPVRVVARVRRAFEFLEKSR
jgi:CheY-like chemotaxis protein